MDASNLLTHRALLSPENEAVVDLGTSERYTYAAINKRAIQVAHWLIGDVGTKYGNRVSLLGHNSIAYVDLFFACGKIGGVFTPLNWRLTVIELAWIINNCQPIIVIVEPEFSEIAQALKPLTNTQFVMRADYEQSLANQISEFEPERPNELNAESTHAILYTSGTTGRPKGALIPHRQVLWNAIATATSWELNSADCAPIFTPMFHAGGLFVFLTPLFYVGGKIIITKTFDPDRALNLIKEETCTVILGVPTIFQMWLDGAALRTTDLSKVRYFISGGAPCPVDLIHAWSNTTGVALRQGYGMSEVGVNCFTMDNQSALAKAGSVGKPIFHLEARVVDTDGKSVTTDTAGELIFRGPQVCAGYLNNPAATASAIRNGWFYTGDMVRCDADGFFTIVGRFKDMIISGGENVYAAEVEAVFLQHPQVQACALIGKPDEKWGEAGLLFVVFERSAADTSIEELLAFGRKYLARFKVPKEFVVIDELPYSAYGKVEKLKLKEQYLSTPP